MEQRYINICQIFKKNLIRTFWTYFIGQYHDIGESSHPIREVIGSGQHGEAEITAEKRETGRKEKMKGKMTIK